MYAYIGQKIDVRGVGEEVLHFLNSSCSDLRPRQGCGNGEFSRCLSSLALRVVVVVNLNDPRSFSFCLTHTE